ncbi:MAG: hypothetical protein KY395_04910 [Actinobacteria bacterium]|nr:hypothetical protein [Actinomycetota bacterium]
MDGWLIGWIVGGAVVVAVVVLLLLAILGGARAASKAESIARGLHDVHAATNSLWELSTSTAAANRIAAGAAKAGDGLRQER